MKYAVAYRKKGEMYWLAPFQFTEHEWLFDEAERIAARYRKCGYVAYPIMLPH